MYNVKNTLNQLNKLENNNYKKIILQFPDGLLGEFCTQIVNYFNDKDVEIIISGDPTYGACDLPSQHAILFQVDAIFHFGHSSYAFPPPTYIDIPIYYFPVEVNVEINWELIAEEILRLNWKSIGLVTTIQHQSIIQQAKNIFDPIEVKIFIYREGQILGCNQDRARKLANMVEGFLVIAGGDFHASPIILATRRPTLRFDPFNSSFKLFDDNFRKMYLKKRYAMILKAQRAKNWGILLSTKSGQLPHNFGRDIINMLRKDGKKAFKIPVSRVDANHLINFEFIDAWVINLCPRIATDDSISFNKPILTTKELAVCLGVISWDRFIDPIQRDEEFLIIES